MNSQQRLIGTLLRKPVDRPPVVFRLGLDYLERELLGTIPGQPSVRLQTDLYERLIGAQEELGLDPVIYPHWWHGMFISDWPGAIFHWPETATRDWQVHRHSEPKAKRLSITIQTPGGRLATELQYERTQKWTQRYLINEECDIELLHYRPDPALLDVSGLKSLVERIGQRGIVNLIYPGPWDEALHLRGMDRLLTDVYDRPQWTHEFLATLTEYSVRILTHICTVTGLHCVMQNDSYIGLVSGRLYDKFIAENDARLIAAVKATGTLSDLHNCGKTNHLLERMVAAGPHAIETLTPPIVSSGGDIDLADAKRRVGAQVCLMGGFDERVLASDDPEDVRREARRCLDAAKAGGGYVLYAAGQVMHAKRRNFQLLLDTINQCGAY